MMRDKFIIRNIPLVTTSDYSVVLQIMPQEGPRHAAQDAIVIHTVPGKPAPTALHAQALYRALRDVFGDLPCTSS